jgi:hypothetical protein
MAPTASPVRELTSVEAIAAVVAFVDDAGLTSDLAADGPSTGASGPFYDVTGANIAATVDVSTGNVLTLLYTGRGGAGGGRLTGEQAVAIATDFLDSHSVSYDGMTLSVDKVDHGETWEWDVKWDRFAGNILLPDQIQVGVNPAGQVWRWVHHRQPYSSPGVPRIDQATAEAAAIAAAFVDTPQTSIESAQLTLKVDADGGQRLVWEVQVTGWFPQGSGPLVPRDHAFVDVDAETGVATVVGVG